MQQTLTDSFNIKNLFPSCVVTECCRIQDNEYQLYPEERGIIRKAVRKRQNEFGAGRACARRALERLGFPDHLLIKKPDGSPAWPEGIIGSIAHSHTWCGVAVGKNTEVSGIGFDIETVASVNPNITRKVLTEQEIKWINIQNPQEILKWLALMFSAKESIYKCIIPIVQRSIGFYDAVIIPNTKEPFFEIIMCDNIAACLPPEKSFTGRYSFHDGNVFTSTVLAC